MSTLELNGKDFATQTSSAEPVLASTVTGGAGLSGSTSLGTVTAGTLNSTVTFPAGHTVFADSTRLDSTGLNAQPTAWTSTGLTISVSAANAALGSKILIMYNNTFWIVSSGIEARVAFRLQRVATTGVSAVECMSHNYIGMHGISGMSNGSVFSGSYLDTSLGSGIHTYQVHYHKHTSGDIYYLGMNVSGTEITQNNITIQVIK